MEPITQNVRGIPVLGLGTWKLNGDDCIRAVSEALDLGYRHIDTADMYENHLEIGQAIKGFPRNELFITSKIFLHEKNESPKQAIERFLEELQTSYLDLLLIHWPDRSKDMIEILNEMEELKHQDLTKHIGVSNFTRSHLKPVLDAGLNIFNNQYEMHPFFQQPDLLSFCQENKIVVTAYRPICKGDVEDEKVLSDIGRKFGKSGVQVSLRWLIQKEIVAIPKSSKLEHLKENRNIFDFELTVEEMDKIDNLDRNRRSVEPEWAEFKD